MELLSKAEQRRTETLATLVQKSQAANGQYFTPHLAAKTIAGMPRLPRDGVLRILDPGAGSGILTAALVERVASERPGLAIEATVVENDESLHSALRETLADVESVSGVTTELVTSDFLRWALQTDRSFDIVIQNPPYRKLSSTSADQKLLRDAGIIVPNIYAAFLSLGARLLNQGGQQVAITPRSWMNGTYYSTFRRELVSKTGIDAIHTFASRSKVFADTGVLQESIIVSSSKGMRPENVLVTTSLDHVSESSSRTVPYEQIVTPDFIHVPTSQHDADAVAWMTKHAKFTLAELGLSVSTGRVVDFRSRDLIHQDPPLGAWPLLHATHVKGGIVHHPVKNSKKPEWFHGSQDAVSKFLVPHGSYVLIKRFSAKEERRRVVAGLWESGRPAAFDNKLNFIHENGHGIDPTLAKGLMIFLNSTQLDDYFRVFSGHTQVNATDLRQMRFPSLQQLSELGLMDLAHQSTFDSGVARVLEGTVR